MIIRGHLTERSKYSCYDFIRYCSAFHSLFFFFRTSFFSSLFEFRATIL